MMLPASPVWAVPVELAIATGPDHILPLVIRRRAEHDHPLPHARVFIREGWLFAVVEFKSGRAFQFRLRPPLTENAGFG